MSKRIIIRPVGFLLLLFTIQIIVSAQTGNVSGSVTESARKLALTGASVRVEGQGIQAVTDDSGRYLLQGVRAGKVKISASYLGMQTASEEITVRANATITWDPILTLAAQEYSVNVSADPIMVGQARALNDQKNSINLVNLVASDQIGSFPDPNAAEAIQ